MALLKRAAPPGSDPKYFAEEVLQIADDNEIEVEIDIEQSYHLDGYEWVIVDGLFENFILLKMLIG